MKNQKLTALALALALVLSLGGAVVAQETAEETPPADGAETMEILSPEESEGASQDIQPPQPQEPEEPEEDPVPVDPYAPPAPPASPDPAGVITWANLESRARGGYLKLRILEESIQSAQATDFDKLKEDLRKQLNSIADQQFMLQPGGGNPGPDMSGLFTPEMGATPQDQYLFGAMNAVQMGMGALQSMMASSMSRSLAQAYDAVREQYDALVDGETQKSVEDTVWQLRTMQNTDVMMVQATYAQLVELQSALETLDRSVAALDRQVKEMEARYQMGQISALTLQQIRNARTSLNSQRQSYANSAAAGLRGLEFMLGLEPTGTSRLEGLPTVTGEQLAAMDLEADLARAKGNSFTLYNAKKTLDDARETFEDAGDEYYHNDEKYQFVQARHSWNAAQLTYDAAVQSFEMSFRNLYNQVKDYRQVLDASRTALACEEAACAAQELKYEQGTLSRNKLMDARDSLASARDAVATAQRNLFSSYNNYCWAVEYGILN